MGHWRQERRGSEQTHSWHPWLPFMLFFQVSEHAISSLENLICKQNTCFTFNHDKPEMMFIKSVNLGEIYLILVLNLNGVQLGFWDVMCYCCSLLCRSIKLFNYLSHLHLAVKQINPFICLLVVHPFHTRSLGRADSAKMTGVGAAEDWWPHTHSLPCFLTLAQDAFPGSYWNWQS